MSSKHEYTSLSMQLDEPFETLGVRVEPIAADYTRVVISNDRYGIIHQSSIQWARAVAETVTEAIEAYERICAKPLWTDRYGDVWRRDEDGLMRKYPADEAARVALEVDTLERKRGPLKMTTYGSVARNYSHEQQEQPHD